MKKTFIGTVGYHNLANHSKWKAAEKKERIISIHIKNEACKRAKSTYDCKAK